MIKKSKKSRPKNTSKNSDCHLPKNGGILKSTVRKVSKAWYPIFNNMLDIDDFQMLCFKTADLYNHLVKHRGVLQGTKRFKQIRVYTLKWILGLQVEPVPCLSLNKKGFPRDLMFLKEYCINRSDNLKMVYTILNISRLSQFRGPLDKESLRSIYKNVERDDSFKRTIRDFDLALPSLLKSLGIRKTTALKIGEKIRYHNSGSNGPNSSVSKLDALLSAPYDAKAIFDDNRLNIHIKRLLNSYGMLGVWYHICKLASNITSEKKLIHSKIALIPDNENKQRIVAIVDYWTQMILLPLEDHLNKVIHLVPNNHMFNQDRGREIVKEMTINDHPYSLDGSDFTDRFPKELQRVVLKHLVSEEYANCIFKLLTDREFFINKESTVRYQVGQPMGAHSSFHLANITHSLLAIWCCRLSGDKSPYSRSSVVCGDDIVLKNDKIASLYKQKMKSLKMEFSEFKGFDSDGDCKVSEFCKKLYRNGETINGLSPNPFLNYARDYKYVLSCIQSASLDEEKAISWILGSCRGKPEPIFDLLVLNELTGGIGISIYRSPYLRYCSSQLQSDIDTFVAMGEIEGDKRINLINLISIHQLKVNENFFNKKNSIKLNEVGIEKPTFVDDELINPLSLKNDDGRDKIFFQKMVCDVVAHSMTKVIDVDNIEDPKWIPNPIFYWYLNIEDPSKGHKYWTPFKASIKVKNFEEKISEFTSLHGLFKPLKQELYVAIFTGMQTTALATITRIDTAGSKKVAQKQFLLSARLRKLINEFYEAKSFYPLAKKLISNTFMPVKV